jgi:hypothetical protein
MIIYTCITNGYDEISDDHYYDPDVQYICFTDGTVEPKGAWEFREIPIEHECPRRLSAYPKINPHKLFPIGSEVVWIDGCYLITKELVDNCKNIFKKSSFKVLRHPAKFTYLDEITEGFEASMNTWDDGIEITTVLKSKGYNFKNYRSGCLGLFWRKITEDIFDFHDIWWEYSLIGPNRDQISFDAARQFTCIDIEYDSSGWLNGVGTMLGTRGKVGRKKLHPQSGHSEQWKQRKEFLQELYIITGLRPTLYATYDHSAFVHRNVIKKYLPDS